MITNGKGGTTRRERTPKVPRETPIKCWSSHDSGIEKETRPPLFQIKSTSAVLRNRMIEVRRTISSFIIHLYQRHPHWIMMLQQVIRELLNPFESLAKASLMLRSPLLFLN